MCVDRIQYGVLKNFGKNMVFSIQFSIEIIQLYLYSSKCFNTLRPKYVPEVKIFQCPNTVDYSGYMILF